jgi:CRISPR-associated RAMP protein (TIGR02581 family)
MSRETVDKFISRVKITGSISVETGLRIGVGKVPEVSSTDMPVIKDIYGRPFIPGSSFKGVLRSNIESLARTINNKPNFWTCDMIDDENEACVKKEDRDKISKEEWKNYVKNKSCTVCWLFGSPWVASRVIIPDMMVKDWKDAFVTVRDSVAILRDTETAKPKSKYDFEVISKGTEFSLEIILENPEDWEIGLILYGLDMFNKGYAFLGGNVSRGLGKVSINIEKIEKITLEELLNNTPQTVDIKKLKKEFEDYLGGKNV